MKQNKPLRAKLCIISFALVFSLFYSCTESNLPVNKEFLRFEEMLVKSGLQSKDSVTYILWNNSSCGGCRDISADFIHQNVIKSNIKILTPKIHAYFLPKTLEESQYYIDESNVFGKKYVGIDNIGIIKTANGKVYSIKNYNPDEMEQFKIDVQK